MLRRTYESGGRVYLDMECILGFSFTQNRAWEKSALFSAVSQEKGLPQSQCSRLPEHIL